MVVHNGILDIHGIPRNPTWTMMSTTALKGATQIHLLVPVDWKVGEEIGIAPTNFTGNESEFRKIIAVSADKKTLTLN